MAPRESVPQRWRAGGQGRETIGQRCSAVRRRQRGWEGPEGSEGSDGSEGLEGLGSCAPIRVRLAKPHCRHEHTVRRSLSSRRNLRDNRKVEIDGGELVGGRSQDGGHAVFVRTGVLWTGLHPGDNASWWWCPAENDPAGFGACLAAFPFKPSSNVSAIGVCKAVPTANATGRVVLATDEVSLNMDVEIIELSKFHRDLPRDSGRANETQGIDGVNRLSIGYFVLRILEQG